MFFEYHHSKIDSYLLSNLQNIETKWVEWFIGEMMVLTLYEKIKENSKFIMSTLAMQILQIQELLSQDILTKQLKFWNFGHVGYQKFSLSKIIYNGCVVYLSF